MKIIIGQVATGEFFYKRENFISNFWGKIHNGNNILISAPRRIGKTSLMQHLVDNPQPGYQVIYLITESVNNKNEFFRKLVHEICTKLTSIKKFSSSLSHLAKSKTIKSIGPDGISFDKNEINYYQEFEDIVSLLDLKGDKLIIMVDEFAQTVENITQDETEAEAIQFLQSNREIRNNPKINNKIQFIYAGSIGLENIVSSLNAISSINDLCSFSISPLTTKEAVEYINLIPLKNTDFIFKSSAMEYMLQKIGWLIPFFINVLLDEMESLCNELNTKEITNKIVDHSINNAILHRNYFEHWHIRLRKAYKKEYYNFSKEVLNLISVNSKLTSNEIFNLAVSYKIEDKYKDILNSLVYDGYINNNENTKVFQFNSPLLRIWWYNNVTV